MITDEVFYSLQSANRELLKAENELRRPHEDVVTLSACRSIRNSMKKIMQLYLSAQSISATSDSSLDDLLSQCINANPKFSSVYLGAIECSGHNHKHCEGKYCLSVEAVNSCLNAATRLKSLVWSELKI